MKKVIVLCAVALVVLLLLAPVVGCKQKQVYPQRVSLEEANIIIEALLPVPTYLPEGFEIIGIYMLERSDYSEHMVLFISDEAIDEKQLSDINEVPRKMEMYVTLYRRGQVGGLKLPGEWLNIGDTEGVLVTRETTNELWWILTHPERPGQYELKLSAIKEIPKEELVKIAGSVRY